MNPAFNLALNKEWSSIITPLQIETQGATLESHLAGGYVETPHFVKLRERSPTVPRIAKCIYVLVDHEISRWHRKKPPYRDYSHGALAEEFDCSVRTVKRAVAWLHANEWLYIERDGTGKPLLPVPSCRG